MKKKELWIIAAALVVVVAVGVVLAIVFTKPAKDVTTTTAAISTTAAQSTSAGDNTGKTTTTEKVSQTTANAATKGAKVIGSDAIDTIKALSNDQLGLKNKDDYSFMVSNQSYTVNGDKYIQVIAAKKKANHDDTIQIITYGKYYISFDGSVILKQDMKTNKYSTIK